MPNNPQNKKVNLPRTEAFAKPRLQDAKSAATQFLEATSVLSKFEQGKTFVAYRKNQTIFSQGDLGDAVFYIQTGKVKLTIVSEHGREAVIAILGDAEFFGEGCLADQQRRIATATAISLCSIMRLEKNAIIRVLNEEPAFSAMFLKYLLARNVRFEADLVDHLFNSSEKRLARVLLQLANVGKEKSEHVLPKISQETLAELVGTTRPRVNLFMNKFRKLGFIEYNGGIKIHSSLLNILLSD
jgi:CRP/FNR family cyclic AMP-dependent transcriptional regulator